MKRIFIALALVAFFSVVLFAQAVGPVITTASFMEWDYADDAGITGFRIYVSDAPGVVPDGSTFVAEIPYPTKEWAISLGVGQKYAVCSAYMDDGAGTITESGPSNELAFFVLDGPTNFRIR
ncbi:MAG: hypothetical protein ACYSX1_02200 [Planctomycetota bacterium]|jgi:hypothetical protein